MANGSALALSSTSRTTEFRPSASNRGPISRRPRRTSRPGRYGTTRGAPSATKTWTADGGAWSTAHEPLPPRASGSGASRKSPGARPASRIMKPTSRTRFPSRARSFALYSSPRLPTGPKNSANDTSVTPIGGADSASVSGRFSAERTPCDCATWRCQATAVTLDPAIARGTACEKSASTANAAPHGSELRSPVDARGRQHAGYGFRSGGVDSCTQGCWAVRGEADEELSRLRGECHSRGGER